MPSHRQVEAVEEQSFGDIDCFGLRRHPPGSRLTVNGADEAVMLLRRAVEQDETAACGGWRFGAAHSLLGHDREARYCYTRARRLEGSPTRFNTAGGCCVRWRVAAPAEPTGGGTHGG